METKLNKYKGRLFVQLCNCNSNWKDDLKKFGSRVLCYDRSNVSPFASRYPGADRGTMIPVCEKCGADPWIILPEGEKYDKKEDK